MEVGQLRNRVELINCVRTETAAGGQARTDSVEAMRWAHVAPASPQQQKAAERLEQRISWVVTIRWDRDLARAFGPEARVRFEDHAGITRSLSVKTKADPHEGTTQQGFWLELGCAEGGPV